MRADSPPTPEDNHWVADYASSNGAASNARRERANRLVALAYILAVSVPPIGFGLGIVLTVRFSNLRTKHGLWIIVVSIIASIVWILIIGSGALSTPTNDY